jgi:hypothetical protein
MIGKSFKSIPYISQSKTPVQKIENIPRDRSLADFVSHVFITCGKKATVVSNPAI